RGRDHETCRVDAGEQQTLERSIDGSEGRLVADGDRKDLAGFRIAATSSGELQVLQRPAIRGEGARHCGLISESTGSRDCPLCGRKESGSGVKSNAADSTPGSGCAGAPVARL